MKLKQNILMVEDNLGDARLIKEILNEFKISNDLYHAKDGAIALQMLYREGEYSNIPRPDLILLDMDLPKKDGKDVLKDIKLNNKLNNISIIILTGSAQDVENNTYAKFVDAILLKSTELEEFEKIANCIQKVLNKIKK
jgi:CheY-like chemotaxis protein